MSLEQSLAVHNTLLTQSKKHFCNRTFKPQYHLCQYCNATHPRITTVATVAKGILYDVHSDTGLTSDCCSAKISVNVLRRSRALSTMFSKYQSPRFWSNDRRSSGGFLP